MKIWLSVFAAATLAVGQTPYKAPRTSEGKPDLSGIWFTQAFAAAWDIEDHPTVPNVVGGPSILIDPPDKKIPYQAWGPAKRKDLIEKRNLKTGKEITRLHALGIKWVMTLLQKQSADQPATRAAFEQPIKIWDALSRREYETAFSRAFGEHEFVMQLAQTGYDHFA